MSLLKKNNSNKKDKFDGNGDKLTTKRTLQGGWKKLLWVSGLLMAIAHIYLLAIHPVNPWILFCIHFGFGFSIIIATRGVKNSSPKNRIPIFDLLIIAIIIINAVYISTNLDGILARSGVNPTTLEQVLFFLLAIIVLEVARRTVGWILPSIGAIALLYARYGYLFPGEFGHRGYTWKKIFSFLVSTEAIFSTPFNASATMVLMFIVFGAFLQASGASQYFIDLSLATAGGTRGGPAKVAVISSALFGSVSGNSVANVVSTGSMTIPLMKSIGYKSTFAGAAESVASAGGQFMPPVLGSAAFIMAEIVGVSYSRIIQASLIPALLYFFTVFMMVDLQAIKRGLTGMPKDQLPPISSVLKRLYFVIPLVTLIIVLSVFNWSPVRSALIGITSCILVSWIDRKNIILFKNFLKALSAGAIGATPIIAACSTAGLVIGVLNLTGSGLKLAGIIIGISHGYLPAALFLTMIASLIMGMGLPTAASYLICAAVTVPTLVELNVPVLSAHMFVFFFRLHLGIYSASVHGSLCRSRNRSGAAHGCCIDCL